MPPASLSLLCRVLSLAVFLSAASLAAASLTLEWDDNSGNEEAFIVERSADGLAYAEIARVPANRTSYTDTRVIEGKAYFYRVRAVNAFGASEPSNATSGAVLPEGFDGSGERLLVNLSARARAGQGDGALIVGFVVEGSGAKRALVRGIGPHLKRFGVPGAVADPSLALYRAGSSRRIGSNDDWWAAANGGLVAEASLRVGAFPLSEGSRDAALLASLSAGGHTAHVQGGGGVAMVEVYDADATALGEPLAARLSNLSLRGRVGSGREAVIMGFVVGGDTPKRVLIRAVGPELAGFGIERFLADPKLTLYKGPHRLLVNDDWEEDRPSVKELSARLGALPLEAGSTSAAAAVWLEPGAYTVLASGVGGAAGVALMDVFAAAR